jgi:MoaA/NifB/PqqE/SkfB family radical SAM enzyme
LLEHYAVVTVSVDAIGHAHDGLRGSRGLYQRLARSVRALAAHKRARGAGPLLRMNTVLMRDNANDFGALCRTAARWGIDEITFNQLGGNDRPAYFPANRLLPSQVETLATQMPALREELAQHGVVLRGSRNYLQRLAASSRGAKLAPLDCAPGSRFLWIDEAGVAAPCAHTPREYGVPVSELRSTDDLAMLPARFAALRRVRRAQACADCHSTQHHGKFSAVTPASVTA